MNSIAIVAALFEGFKASMPVILAVASGLGVILTKGLGWGISEVFQGLTMIFGGASLVGVRSAVAEVSALLKAAAPAPTPTGTEPAAGTK